MDYIGGMLNPNEKQNTLQKGNFVMVLLEKANVL